MSLFSPASYDGDRESLIASLRQRANAAGGSVLPPLAPRPIRMAGPGSAAGLSATEREDGAGDRLQASHAPSSISNLANSPLTLSDIRPARPPGGEGARSSSSGTGGASLAEARAEAQAAALFRQGNSASAPLVIARRSRAGHRGAPGATADAHPGKLAALDQIPSRASPCPGKVSTKDLLRSSPFPGLTVPSGSALDSRVPEALWLYPGAVRLSTNNPIRYSSKRLPIYPSPQPAEGGERAWLAKLSRRELGPVSLSLGGLDPSFPKGAFPALSKAVATSSYLVHEVARHVMGIGADPAGQSYSPLARVLLEVSECLAAGLQALVLEVAREGGALSAARDYVEALSIQASVLVGEGGGDGLGAAERAATGFGEPGMSRLAGKSGELDETGLHSQVAQLASPKDAVLAAPNGAPADPGYAVAESIMLSSALDARIGQAEVSAARDHAQQLERLHGLLQDKEQAQRTLELQIQRAQHELRTARETNARLQAENEKLARRLGMGAETDRDTIEASGTSLAPTATPGAALANLARSTQNRRSASQTRPFPSGEATSSLESSQFVSGGLGASAPARPRSQGGRRRLQTLSEVNSSYAYTRGPGADGGPALGATLTASQLTGPSSVPEGQDIDEYLSKPDKMAHIDYIPARASPALEQGPALIDRELASQVESGSAGSRGAAITASLGRLIPIATGGQLGSSQRQGAPPSRPNPAGPETDGAEIIGIENAAVSPTGEVMHSRKLLATTQTGHGVTADTIAAASSYVNAINSLADDDAWRIEAAVRGRIEFEEGIAADHRAQEAARATEDPAHPASGSGSARPQLQQPKNDAEAYERHGNQSEFSPLGGRQPTDEYYYSALTPVISAHSSALGSVDLKALGKPVPQLGDYRDVSYVNALDEAAPRSGALLRGLGLARITFDSPEQETLSAAGQGALLGDAVSALQEDYDLDEQETLQVQEIAEFSVNFGLPPESGLEAIGSAGAAKSVAEASGEMYFADAIAPDEPDTRAWLASDAAGGVPRRMETLEDYSRLVTAVDAVYGFRQAKLGRMLGRPCFLHPKYVLAETSILDAMLASGAPGLTKLEMERTAEYGTLEAYNQLRERGVLQSISSRRYCADSIFSFTTSGSLLSLREGKLGGREGDAINFLWCDFASRFSAEEDGVHSTEDPAFSAYASRARVAYFALDGLDPAAYLGLVNSAVINGVVEIRLADISPAAAEALEKLQPPAVAPSTGKSAGHAEAGSRTPQAVSVPQTPQAAETPQRSLDVQGTLGSPGTPASQSPPSDVDSELFCEEADMTRFIPAKQSPGHTPKHREAHSALPETSGSKTHCLGLNKKGGLYKLLGRSIRALEEQLGASAAKSGADASRGAKPKGPGFSSKPLSHISRACQSAGLVLLDLRSLLSFINDVLAQRLACMETLPYSPEGVDPGRGYTPFWRFFVQVLLQENEMDWERACAAAASVLLSVSVHAIQDALAGARTYSDMLLLFLDLLNSEDPRFVEFVVWAYKEMADFCGPRHPYPFVSCEQAVLAFRSLLPEIPEPYRVSLEAQIAQGALTLRGARVVDLGAVLRMLARQKAMMQILFINSLAEDYGSLLETGKVGPPGGARFGVAIGGDGSSGAGGAFRAPGLAASPSTPVSQMAPASPSGSSTPFTQFNPFDPSSPFGADTPGTPKAAAARPRSSSPLRPKSSLGKHGKKKRGAEPIRYSRYSATPIRFPVLVFLLERYGVVVPRDLLGEVYAAALSAGASGASGGQTPPGPGISPALPSIRAVLEALAWAPRDSLLDCVLAGSPYLCLFRGRYGPASSPDKRLVGLFRVSESEEGENGEKVARASLDELVELVQQILVDIERPVKTLASMLTCEGSGLSYSKGPWYVAEPRAREALSWRDGGAMSARSARSARATGSGSVRRGAPAAASSAGSVSPLVPSLELRGLLATARMSGEAEKEALVGACTSYTHLGPIPSSRSLVASQEGSFTFNCLAFVSEPRRAQGAFARRLVYEYLALKVQVARVSRGSGGRRAGDAGALVCGLRRVFRLCEEGYSMLMPYNSDSEFLLYELAVGRQELVKRHAFLCGNLTEEKAARMALGAPEGEARLLRVIGQARNSALFL